MSETKEKFSLPMGDLKISAMGNTEVIWDVVRKKNVVLTPEELVRQKMIHYLAGELGYPPSHMGIEKLLKVNGRRKRTDMVIFGESGDPKMIVELKAPSVKIDQSTFSQIAAYNSALRVDFILLSNGDSNFCFKLDHKKNKLVQLNQIPPYSEIK